MKKTTLKFINWLAITAFFLNAEPFRLGEFTRLAALTIAVQQASQNSLFAPNLGPKKSVFQIASTTSSVYDIGNSTPAYGPSLIHRTARTYSAPTFSLLETPRKIFIPESAIVSNAAFVLNFDNPAADIITQAKVFDITGGDVADMQEVTPSGSNPARLSWDGRDRNGSVVPSGIYIYQVQAGGVLINGTVVVAR